MGSYFFKPYKTKEKVKIVLSMTKKMRLTFPSFYGII